MVLSRAAEQVATFYGKMLGSDDTTKEVFIRDFSKCDFSELPAYFKEVKEKTNEQREKDDKEMEAEFEVGVRTSQ